jgi:hypothetical protein
MSEIKVDTLTGKTSAGDITVTSEGGAATMQLQQGLAKAWVNFNGTGTIASRDSLGVSGLVDNGTGDYTVTMSSAMATASYSFLGTASQATTGNNGQMVSILESTVPTTTVLRFRTQQDGIGVTDSQYVCLAVHGDLA